MLRRVLTAVLAAVALAPAAPALADEPPPASDYFQKAPSSTAITFRTPGRRTTGQRVLVWGLLGGAAVAGGVGVWFHLDSYRAAGEVSEDSMSSGVWTDEHQATYDRAGTSGTVAIVGYSVSAALLVGSAVAAWLTQPADQAVTLEPVRGGAVVGKAWSW